MRCLPGLQPVWNDVQATGDSARSVVWRGLNVPRSRSFAKFGSSPSARNCSVSSGSWPSRPRTTTRRARAAPRARLPRMRCTTQRIGPGQERQDRQERRDEDDQQRRDEREPGPRTDVGQRRRRRGQQQDGGGEPPACRPDRACATCERRLAGERSRCGRQGVRRRRRRAAVRSVSGAPGPFLGSPPSAYARFRYRLGVDGARHRRDVELPADERARPPPPPPPAR